MKKLSLLFLFLFISITSCFATVTVKLNPDTSNISVCQGSAINLICTVTGGTGATSYHWKLNGNYLSDTTSTYLFNAFTLGNNTIKIEVIKGSDTGSASIAVFVNPNPAANFSVPSTINCANIPINFSDLSVGNGLTYLWNFGNSLSGTNNTSTQQNPNHLFSSAIGDTTQFFTVRLSITNQFGCKDTISHIITVKQIPDPTISDSLHPVNPFIHCISASDTTNKYTLFIKNSSTTSQSNINYMINWGDSDTNYSFTDTIKHQYNSIGYFVITNTVTSNNGCVNTKTYDFFNGWNPSISISNLGNIAGCLPNYSSFTFPINYTNSAGKNNVPGTIYTIELNDTNTIYTYNHPYNTNPQASFTHTFIKPSCGTNSYLGSTVIPNSFQVKITAANSCGISSARIAPITISSAITNDFSINPTSLNACINSTFLFSDSTNTGCFIDQNYNQSNVYKRNWIITPNSGWIVSSGNIGDAIPTDNPSTWGSGNLGVIFTSPGNYQISLVSENSCGKSTKTKSIYISPIPVPSFTLNKTSVCMPDVVNITNTVNDTIPTVFNWLISCTNNACDNSNCNTGYFYTGGTTSNSKNPQIQFTKPGIYSITLKILSGCNPVTSLPQIVTVKNKPIASFSIDSSVCISDTISVKNINVIDCYGNIPTTYLWNSSAPSIIIPNQYAQSPSFINTTIGINIITLSASNECGTTVVSDSLNAYLLCNKEEIIGDTNICQRQAFSIYSIKSTPIFTAYNWSISPSNAATINASDTTAIVNWNSTFSGIAVISVNGNNGSFISNTANLLVKVKPLPTIVAPTNKLLCNGDPLSIIFTGTFGNLYSWINNDTLIGINYYGTGNISDTAKNTGNAPIEALIKVIPSNNGCIGDTSSFTITIKPTPSKPIVSDSIYFCQYMPASVLYAIGNNILWYPSLNGGVGDTIAPIPSTDIINNLFFYVSQTINGCESTREKLTVNIRPKPQTPIVNQYGGELISSTYGNQWYNLTNGPINNANGQLYFPQNTGNYFTISTINGCSSDTSNIVYFEIVSVSEFDVDKVKVSVMPNPFSNTTKFSYYLNTEKFVRLSITDITGREITVLCDEKQEAGEHLKVFNAENLTSGIYFYKINADKDVFTGKIVLTK